jgi:hypothetical protein
MLIALVAVVTAILVAQLPQGLGTGLLPPDAPAATLDPTHTVTWSHGVPWGVLNVDGTAMAIHTYVPAAAPGALPDNPRPIVLAPGHHTLEYIALPFPTRTCTVDVPSIGDDTCPETGVGNSGIRQLDLRATPDALPAAAYHALQAAVQQAFDTSQANAVLDPGVRFLAPNGQLARAREKVALQPQYLLNLTPSAQSGSGAQCLSICDAGDNAGYGSTWWAVLAATQVVLDYQKVNGESLYSGAPAAPVPAESHILLPLGVAWSGTEWHVRPTGTRPGTTSPFCLIATVMRSQLRAPAAQVAAAIAIEWSSATDVPLFRCLLAGDEGEPLRPASAKARKVLLLYQYGLLLAATPAAHQIYPQLPVASDAEQQLADKYTPAS